jgi:hypothetical protein
MTSSKKRFVSGILIVDDIETEIIPGRIMGCQRCCCSSDTKVRPFKVGLDSLSRNRKFIKCHCKVYCTSFRTVQVLQIQTDLVLAFITLNIAFILTFAANTQMSTFEFITSVDKLVEN